MMEGPDYAKMYNTPLSNAEAVAFQKWRAGLPRNLQNMSDYDLQGAWKASAKEAGNGHLPDTWKKPNHPTFSQGSQYSGVDGNVGGNWVEQRDGSWMFVASPTNLKHFNQQQLRNYFEEAEPGNQVVFPGPGAWKFAR